MIEPISTSLWFLFAAISLVTCGLSLGVQITTRKLSREHLENLCKHREESIRDKIQAIAQIRRESDPGGHWSHEVKKLKKENGNGHLVNLRLTERVAELEALVADLQAQLSQYENRDTLNTQASNGTGIPEMVSSER